MHRSFSSLAIANLILVAASCCYVPPPPAPTPPEPEPPSASCAEACDRMRELVCDLGRDTVGGFTCEDVCENTKAGSPSLAWDTDCLANAVTCEDCDEGDWEDER